MQKTWQPQEYEKAIYQKWEKSKAFTPEINPDLKPFTILLPPPNANDPLHIGHAMYVVEDILCRYHRMKGQPTLFLPGADHAGIETQYVFEKKLAKKGKSRFDYDRQTLFDLINDYVEKNRGLAAKQLKQLGFSLDWSRERYTLEPKILKIVFNTFRQLHQDKLIYRHERLVNYCTRCGTAFSNLEINHLERENNLYYLDYKIINIATTRPETIFADVALAVHPDDKRYQELIGKKAIVPLINKKIPVIADPAVDPKFGAGALKITPGHDFLDFEIGEKHKLPRVSIVDRSGKMTNLPKEYLGLTVKKARQKTIQNLKKNHLLIKTKPLTHTVSVCYRCQTDIEPLLLPQWYVRINPLKKPVVNAIKKEKVKFFPLRFKKEMLHWLETAPDWNISRQIVWGPRIPAWYCLNCNPEIEISFLDQKKKTITGKSRYLLKKYPFSQIKKGLQNLIAPTSAVYQLKNDLCQNCQGKRLLQETDTFDTWFSSGQWPLTTLGYPHNPDFLYFYPAAVLDTLWDILAFWVMRMLIFGLYRTRKVPFKWVHLHAKVVDETGKKMSKSRGNVANPIDLINEFGADALRLALIFGVAPASDTSIGQTKLIGMRNFANKIWNIGRFIQMQSQTANIQYPMSLSKVKTKNSEDQQILKGLNRVIKSVTNSLDRFRFSDAISAVYDFAWHNLADQYLEQIKPRLQKGETAPLLIAFHVYLNCLKLLHPFAPFVTEALWAELSRLRKPPQKMLTTAAWPNSSL